MTYPIADLIVPMPGHPRPAKKEAIADALIKVIGNTICPHTWKQADGAGTIEYFPFGMALVIQQSEGVHAEIARLLAELRRSQNTQVSVELRLVDVPDLTAKHLHRAMVGASSDAVGESATVDENQMTVLLKLAQSDESSKLTQAPKVTMFQGQRVLIKNETMAPGGLRIGADGFDFKMASTVNTDKSVRLTLQLDHPAKAGGTFVVAPGRTLLWHVGETREGRRLFVLATPRVVVVEEEERIFLGGDPPIPVR